MNLARCIIRASLMAIAFTMAAAAVADARTPHDGRWTLTIMTTRGACGTYTFPVDIINDRISFPGLVRARGSVTRTGIVRVIVAVQDKYASGSGHLSLRSGYGRWRGRTRSAANVLQRSRAHNARTNSLPWSTLCKPGAAGGVPQHAGSALQRKIPVQTRARRV